MIRRPGTLILLISIAVGTCSGVYLQARREPIMDVLPSHSIAVGGQSRTVRLVVPRARLQNRTPVVLVFHGIGDSPASMAADSRLDELACKHRFILAFPAARNGMWSVPQAQRPNEADDGDLRFVDELVADLANRWPVDMHRIYALGMSQGAIFVQHVTIARPELLAAAVGHSGINAELAGESEPRCPVMLIVGMDDAPATIAAMRSATERYRQRGCLVQHVEVAGTSHSWAVGENNRIWQFISAHAR